MGAVKTKRCPVDVLFLEIIDALKKSGVSQKTIRRIQKHLTAAKKNAKESGCTLL